MKKLERLQRAIRDLHGCDSVHVASIAVSEMFRGQPWKGIVEVFALKNHPKALDAYAWSCETEVGQTRYIAVLGVPPINSAYDAVRAYMAGKID